MLLLAVRLLYADNGTEAQHRGKDADEARQAEEEADVIAFQIIARVCVSARE